MSTRAGNTTLFRLSTDDEHCDARNNVFFVTAAPHRLAILNQDGVIDLSHNWLEPGWVASHGGLGGVINDDGTSITGVDPGFGVDYALTGVSACVDAAGPPHPATTTPDDQYTVHRRRAPRDVIGAAPDVGALEWRVPGDLDGDGVVAVDDLVAIILAWGPCPPPPAACVADLDGSQRVDVDDLVRLIEAWGSG